jgi:DNA-binding NtrC family response regulator
MPFSRRLVLVGTDHRFSQTIQTHLHKTFLLTAPVVRAEDVSALVTRDSDGAMIFLVADAADVDKVEAAVRDLRVQQLPPRLAVLEADGFALPRRLDAISAHLDGRFAWPAQLRELNAWVRKAVTPGEPFADPAHEGTGDRIRRRLLALTPSLAPLVPQLEIAAAHDVTVLIEGETGTGKTHIAKLIHDCSARSAHRFLVVPCGALSGNLIASEFFGHVRGAFTGADAAKVGKFAAAGSGTILLDEIDTLGLDHQSNLLRVIETGEYEPVGSNETHICQARIIAATNWDLAEAVDKGTFRRDLYYRLHVVTLNLPPLRARPQDIGPLVRGMVARYAGRFNKRVTAVSPEAVAALEQFPWPGNIRQLENAVQQAVLTCPGEELTLAHLPPAVVSRADGTPTPVAVSASSLAHTRETTERAVILRCLEKANGSRTRAAQALGVSRVTLYKKMVKYGLIPDPKKRPADVDTDLEQDDPAPTARFVVAP